MNKLIKIVYLIYLLIEITSQQRFVQQKGLGLNCKSENRDFWKNVRPFFKFICCYSRCSYF